MVTKNELNVTALVQLLHHVENVAETRLSGTAGTDAAAASWLTLINLSLRAAVEETERAARRLNASGVYGNNGMYRNNNITV